MSLWNVSSGPIDILMVIIFFRPKCFRNVVCFTFVEQKENGVLGNIIGYSFCKIGVLSCTSWPKNVRTKT